MEQESEASLEQSMEEYGQQISQLESLCQAGGGEPADDLRELLVQLKELRTLTGESLLIAKKNRLLQMLSDGEPSSIPQTTGVVPQSSAPPHPANHSTGSASNVSASEAVPGSDADVLGMKCRAPLVQSWGASQYYNAIIYSAEEADKDGQDQVRVLFTHPTHLPIKPCPHFLEGKCRFTEDVCRCSHGHVVLVSHLEPYKEPDFSLLQAGASCWAKYEHNELWYEATVLAAKDDHRWLVVYTAYNETAIIPAEHIFPQDLVDRSDSYDSDDDDEELRARSNPAGYQEERSAAWHMAGAKRSLGDWERYTSGFGSKMLAKMGYVTGHGLGKDLEGRVEPVEVEVLPPGHSLDMCAEMREKGQLHRMHKKRKRNTQMTDKALEQEAEDEAAPNVFDLINVLCATDNTKGQGTRKAKKSKEDDRKLDKKTLNVKLFQNQEDVRNTQKKLVGYQQALKRNTGTSLQGQCERKVAEVQQELQRLDSREKTLQQQLQRNVTHKKLTVF